MREISGLNEELLVSEEGFCTVEPLYSIILSSPAFSNRRVSNSSTYHYLLYYAVVTQHIKQLHYYNRLIRLHISAVTRPSSGQQGIVLIKVHSLAFIILCRRYTTYKTVALLQPVNSATCFGRYPAIIRPTRNSVN